MVTARMHAYGTPVPRHLYTLWTSVWLTGTSLALVGCFTTRGCEETCEQVVADGCGASGMAACGTLCEELAAESVTSGCEEAWLDLEYCMGLDPVCASDSRCSVEREAYNDCLRAFCAANPSGCSP